MNSITLTEVAALAGLTAVVTMCVIMGLMIIRERTFSQAPRQPVAIESGSMPISEEVLDE